MARIPHGASTVANPVSGAPGFQTENVFTLAGVPQVARAMLEDIGPRLETGAVVHKVTIRGVRITSYNVCYTKLLRGIHESAFGWRTASLSARKPDRNTPMAAIRPMTRLKISAASVRVRPWVRRRKEVENCAMP